MIKLRRIFSLFLLLLFLGQSLSSETYYMTEEQKRELDEIFQRQEIRIKELEKKLDEQEKGSETQLTLQNQALEKQKETESDLIESEKMLTSSIETTIEAEKSLEKLETRSWIDSLLYFLAGLASGLIFKSIYDQFRL